MCKGGIPHTAKIPATLSKERGDVTGQHIITKCGQQWKEWNR